MSDITKLKCAECNNYTLLEFLVWHQIKIAGKPIQAFKRVCFNCNKSLKEKENYDEMTA